nr:YraN family protein [Aestuariivita boseongensis]
MNTRHHRGRSNYHAGLAAETCIERAYARDGHELIARRWRGQGGEIDLVFRKDDVLAFVEVKQAGDFDRAAESLRPAQMRRIAMAAEEFLGTQPAGSLTECRFDLGLVNRAGAHQIIENAFAVH